MEYSATYTEMGTNDSRHTGWHPTIKAVNTAMYGRGYGPWPQTIHYYERDPQAHSLPVAQPHQPQSHE